MRRVYKYHLEIISGPQSIELSSDARFVHARVGMDGESIFLWFEVDTEKEPTHRRFEVFPTGYDVPGHLHHLVTVSTLDLQLVWHVYEG